MDITNPKLAGLDPRWARFRGFSLLFENPPDSPLYRALRQGVAELSDDELVTTYGLRLLPPETYHVTVWDGVNDGNLDRVAPPHRAAWETFLQSIPLPDFPDELFLDIKTSPLVLHTDWNLRLRCDQIENWSHISLVARLAPADSDSAATLQRLIAARDALSALHDARFGVQPHPAYTPHVTLGYFANDTLAAAAAPAVTRWNDTLLAKTAAHTLNVHRILPSVFTDMASFGRPEP